ncbi:MAG TPA: hypothetical protein VFO76_02645 [Candidatus Kapabacteria bacterium]|nr:hypothetical protein [Candidatus Kapabacteria bacterium]
MKYSKVFLFIAFLGGFIGCQSSKEASFLSRDVSSYQNKRITMITLKNGSVIEFDNVGGRYFEEKSDTGMVRRIIGFSPSNDQLTFEISKVLEVRTRTTETDGAGTFLLVLLTASVVVTLVFIAALSGSSWN